ncbi:MAG: host attachment protein [Parachlamydiaceae bacterium]|nr:host attachment protein [Parachlamydiaceae bacterium]
MKDRARFWILVANSSFAELYSVNNHNEMERLQSFDFPEGRLKSGEVNSDRPGRSHASVGTKRHAYETKINVHTHEQQKFAGQLAHVLIAGNEQGLFERLALVCPPEFLGELRLLLPENLKRNIYKELPKDLPGHLTELARIEQLYKMLDISRPSAASR